MVSSWACWGGPGWKVRWETSSRYGHQAADPDLTKTDDKTDKIVQAPAQLSPCSGPLHVTPAPLHRTQRAAALTGSLWGLDELVQAKTCHSSLQVERVTVVNHCHLLCCLSLLFNFCVFILQIFLPCLNFFVPSPYSFISCIFYFSFSSLPIFFPLLWLSIPLQLPFCFILLAFSFSFFLDSSLWAKRL